MKLIQRDGEDIFSVVKENAMLLNFLSIKIYHISTKKWSITTVFNIDNNKNVLNQHIFIFIFI